MGNCGQKFKQEVQGIFFKKNNGGTQIGQDYSCPRCNKFFPKTTTYNVLNVHLDTCVNNENVINGIHQQFQQNQQQQQQQQEVQQQQQQQQGFTENMGSNNLLDSKKQLNKEKQVSYNENFHWIKVPCEGDKTRYQWERRKTKQIDVQMIKNWQPSKVRECDFEEKHAWFRANLEVLRIPWQLGADWVKIYKDNVLLTSMQEIQQCNLHKEVKVEIIGEKVQDAGGLLREWVHLIIKEAFHQNTGLFIMAETEDVCYRINPDADVDEHIIDCFKLFGKIVGKVIFERIPLNVYLDQTILKHILGQEITLNDIFYFDKQLYKSWKFLLENEVSPEDFYETFAIYRVTSMGRETVELKPGGEQILVTNENKQEYVDLYIKYLTKTAIQPFLEAISQEIYKVVPRELLSVFEVHELEMILNSTPFVSIDDWRAHTQYKGYKNTCKQVQWFWEILESFDQPCLQEFLRYCTGSTRTPVEGFKKLESNRGEYSKFCIVSIPFTKQNPFPIAHTCFNRLELPKYPNKQTQQEHMLSVVKNDLDGVFGME